MLDVEFQNNCVVKTFITVDHYLIEDLINKYFKNEEHEDEYSLPTLEDRNNDSSWEVSVQPKDFGIYEERYLKQIKNGEWPYCFTHSMLNYLCFKGIIKQGKYLIDIYW